jgi:hypothetical protein
MSMWQVNMNNRRIMHSIDRRLLQVDEQLGRKLPPSSKKSLLTQRDKLKSTLKVQFGYKPELVSNESAIMGQEQRVSVFQPKTQHEQVLRNKPDIQLKAQEVIDRTRVDLRNIHGDDISEQLMSDMQENLTEEQYRFEENNKTVVRVISVSGEMLDDINFTQDSIRPYTIYSNWDEDVTKQVRRLRKIDHTQDIDNFNIDVEIEADAAANAAELGVHFKNATAVFSVLNKFKKVLRDFDYNDDDKYSLDVIDLMQNKIRVEYDDYMAGLGSKFKNLSADINDARTAARQNFLDRVHNQRLTHIDHGQQKQTHKNIIVNKFQSHRYKQHEQEMRKRTLADVDHVIGQRRQ